MPIRIFAAVRRTTRMRLRFSAVCPGVCRRSFAAACRLRAERRVACDVARDARGPRKVRRAARFARTDLLAAWLGRLGYFRRDRTLTRTVERVRNDALRRRLRRDVGGESDRAAVGERRA